MNSSILINGGGCTDRAAAHGLSNVRNTALHRTDASYISRTKFLPTLGAVELPQPCTLYIVNLREKRERGTLRNAH